MNFNEEFAFPLPSPHNQESRYIATVFLKHHYSDVYMYTRPAHELRF
jgi:hypothetical protein